MRRERQEEYARIDRAVLRTLAIEAADNDPAVMLDLIDIYVEDTAAHLERIDQAIDEGNFPQIRLSAHSLKSSAATFGAMALSSFCERMETCARSQDLSCIQSALKNAAAEYTHIRQLLLAEREKWSAQYDANED